MKYLDIASRVDTVFAHCAKANGYNGIIRYLDASWGKSQKCINEFEAQQIHSAFLDILLVFETCGGAPGIAGCDTEGVHYFTRSQGIFDAQAALTQARAVGYPEGLPIFFAVDYQATAVEFLQMLDYWEGVHDVLASYYSVGIYGHYYLCQYASINWQLLVSYYWQTMAWSDGKLFPLAHIVQVENDVSICGRQIDRDNAASIRGWYMDDTPLTKAEFEKYKVALQQELNDNYASKNHTHPTVTHQHPVTVPTTNTGDNT